MYLLILDHRSIPWNESLFRGGHSEWTQFWAQSVIGPLLVHYYFIASCDATLLWELTNEGFPEGQQPLLIASALCFYFYRSIASAHLHLPVIPFPLTGVTKSLYFFFHMLLPQVNAQIINHNNILGVNPEKHISFYY